MASRVFRPPADHPVQIQCTRQAQPNTGYTFEIAHTARQLGNSKKP